MERIFSQKSAAAALRSALSSRPSPERVQVAGALHPPTSGSGKPHVAALKFGRPGPLRSLVAIACSALVSCATTSEQPSRIGEANPRPNPSASTKPVPPIPAVRSDVAAPSGSARLPAPPEPSVAATPYPIDSVHSPITEAVLARWDQVMRRNAELSLDRFIKVGDSITATPKFLACFAEDGGGVADATLRALRAEPFDSFRRKSLAAANGWSSWQPLAGAPAPLLHEQMLARGRFALVLLGTNDMETSRVTTFAARYLRLVDTLVAQGVLPLLSTIPERHDRVASRLKVPRFNAVIRTVATQRALPLIDLHLALSRLPNEGLSEDGIHPSAYYVAGRPRTCDLSPAGLRHGYNVRNLISLEALDRARRALSEHRALDPEPVLPGAGTLSLGLPLFAVGQLGPTLGEPGPCLKSLVTSSGQPPVNTGVYSFRLGAPGPVEAVALGAKRGEPLSVGIAEHGVAKPCLVAGRGFKRTLLPAGDYSLFVAAPESEALVGILLGRNDAS